MLYYGVASLIKSPKKMSEMVKYIKLIANRWAWGLTMKAGGDAKQNAIII